MIKKSIFLIILIVFLTMVYADGNAKDVPMEDIENKLIETSRTDEVKVGQTRATKDMETVVLIIKAPLALGEGEEDAYSSVILPKNENEVFPFELDNEYHAESAETILQIFPVLIDSTLTLKEFYN